MDNGSDKHLSGGPGYGEFVPDKPAVQSRRSFFGTLTKGVAAFAILPSSLTYARTWKPTASGLLEPLTIPSSVEIETFTDPDTGLVFLRYKYFDMYYNKTGERFTLVFGSSTSPEFNKLGGLLSEVKT